MIEPAGDLESLTHELETLNRIGAALSAERDTDRLLELILTKAREITASGAGSIYIVETVSPPELEETGLLRPRADSRPSAARVEPVRRLRFTIAQNDSVTLPFHDGALDITPESIAGYVALTGTTVALDDAYSVPEGVPFTFNPRFDEADGYRTRSVLAVPMRTPEGNTVGVLQLINARRDGAIVSYSQRQRSLVASLASQAAVALENSQLWREIRGLFEGFVRASVVAIEARDPATSGHSFRVANLTIAMAEAADRAEQGRFSAVRFSREDMRTIRYASLLHDFGKVAVREEVLVKANKLYPLELEIVRERFKLARRTFECESMQARLDCLLSEGADTYRARAPIYDRELGERLASLEDALLEVQRANRPSLLPAHGFERIAAIAALTFEDVDGTVRPLLNEHEAKVLSIGKGSLSDSERAEIESHVVQTYRFLSQIPWTAEIDRIPAIAAAHHEKLNGTGYPRKLSAAEIPIQTRMMTIADIFDALAASDRPYKKAVPIERALDILQAAVDEGELDRDLFALFLEARVYDRWHVEPDPY